MPKFVGSAAVVVSFVLAASACTSESPSTASSAPSTAMAQCASPSRILESGVNGTEVEGSSKDGITLYGQVQSEGFLLASEAEKKIVWRISGSGRPAVEVTRPGGEESRLAWGLEFHSSSNYARPGDEYGSALVLDEPGCWNIHFSRESGTADVWLQVDTRPAGPMP
ncbi:hypothetical protein [Arthrobacter sp. ov407]|uniref:hypothetical protein n=1 Tax=Arthrobacter sp. ov407 TaxID=1761748 RepID=UPI00115FC7AE|nr:hypothetical protein [Arthrobacter sp. ov407]